MNLQIKMPLSLLRILLKRNVSKLGFTKTMDLSSLSHSLSHSQKEYFVFILNVSSFRQKMQEMAEEEERQRKRDERDGTVYRNEFFNFFASCQSSLCLMPDNFTCQ